MDNAKFSDLMPLVMKLAENPTVLNMLGNLMGQSQGKGRSETSGQGDGGELMSALLGALGSVQGGGDAGRGQSGRVSDLPGEVSQSRGDGGAVMSELLKALNSPGAKPTGINQAFGSREETENRILLLNAVRPYLSEQRRQRLDTVIRLLRIAEAGKLDAFLSGR